MTRLGSPTAPHYSNIRSRWSQAARAGKWPALPTASSAPLVHLRKSGLCAVANRVYFRLTNAKVGYGTHAFDPCRCGGRHPRRRADGSVAGSRGHRRRWLRAMHRRRCEAPTARGKCRKLVSQRPCDRHGHQFGCVPYRSGSEIGEHGGQTRRRRSPGAVFSGQRTALAQTLPAKASQPTPALATDTRNKTWGTSLSRGRNEDRHRG